MTSIDTHLHAAALLRARVRLVPDRSRASQPGVSPGAARGKDPASLAAQRIAALPADDPATPRKAVRAYLETVLLQEFGESLLQDAGFASLVDEVQQQMETEPELAAAARKVASVLLQYSRGLPSTGG